MDRFECESTADLIGLVKAFHFVGKLNACEDENKDKQGEYQSQHDPGKESRFLMVSSFSKFLTGHGLIQYYGPGDENLIAA